MYILNTVIFILLVVGGLVFTLYNLLGWSVMQIMVLLLIGAVFVGGTIWGYKQMYHEDD
ncbi:hypothetical protein R50073_02830 [Maricurvus nonylphenolicus]